MRKLTIIGVIVLVLLGLGALAVILPAGASQNAPSGARWAARHGAAAKALAPQAATDAFTTNDNFVSRTFNHFGNASLGSVIAETWMESGFDDTGTAVDTQGFARAILLPKALRVSLQVQLHGTDADGGNDQVVASSSTVNSAGKLTVQVGTPEISLPSSPKCLFYTHVTVGIRWSDNRLTTAVFEEPISFGPGPTAGCPPPSA